jgi:2,4-dienoyl-CoA reductase-like NADH-dependent reductase (Old Yellow Enzyme family)
MIAACDTLCCTAPSMFLRELNLAQFQYRYEEHAEESLRMKGGKELKNRLTMAPLYLGYAGEGGTVSKLIIDHYRLMAKSGVAMVVVENATVDHPTRK